MFSDFLKLIFTNSYLQLYTNNILSRSIHFWMSLFFVLVFPFYYYFVTHALGFHTDLLLNKYLFFAGGTLLFLLLKRVIEQLLAVTFLKNQGVEIFVYAKQSYLNCLSLVFFLPVLVIHYTTFKNPYIIYVLVALFLVLWVLSYVLAISRLRKQFSYGSFYFILYLCALEIAPTYLMYIMISYGIK